MDAIRGALAALVAQRDQLNAAIAALEPIAGTAVAPPKLPAAARAPQRMPAAVPAIQAPAQAGTLLERATEGILAALRAGPCAPADVTRRVGLDRKVVREAFQRLQDKGIARATGATMNRRWSLASKSATPTKEAV